MNVGSLVKLNSWCRAPGEVGTVIEASWLKGEMHICKVLVKNEIVTLLPEDVITLKSDELPKEGVIAG